MSDETNRQIAILEHSVLGWKIISGIGFVMAAVSLWASLRCTTIRIKGEDGTSAVLSSHGLVLRNQEGGIIRLDTRSGPTIELRHRASIRFSVMPGDEFNDPAPEIKVLDAHSGRRFELQARGSSTDLHFGFETNHIDEGKVRGPALDVHMTREDHDVKLTDGNKVTPLIP